ncbi:MAG TPA: tetratricopeptide repeat protein [Caulobacterales bacterium]|nr:tetratricopeptide repeat protein [Caulobacterales bacterium]
MAKLNLLLAGAVAACLATTALAASPGGGGAGMSPSAPSTSAPHIDPQQAYQQGVAALAAHDYHTAITLLRQVVQASPHDGVANYALGLAYVGNNEPREARRPLERAVRTQEAPPDARLQLGLVYIQLNDRDKAIEQQTALADALAHCDAACGDARRGELQAASDALTAALNPQTPAAEPPHSWNFPTEREGRLAYAAAVGLINTERYGEALTQLARADLALGPHPDIYTYMGFANRKLHAYASAVGYYGAALHLDRDHLGATEYLGELYLEIGQRAKAERQLARLDELCPYGCAEHEELQRWIQVASN